MPKVKMNVQYVPRKTGMIPQETGGMLNRQ